MLGVPILLAAAVGVPYVATNGPDLGGLWDSETASQADSRQAAEGLPARKVTQAGIASDRSVITVPLQDAMQMGVSKEWVYQRWNRKTTALSELGLYGVRVALITGTQLHDLAGSLTYYFGPDGRVQRISFRGRTADTTQLVRLVTQRYGLQRQSTVIVGEQLFQVRRGEQVFSELRTRPESILRTRSPHESFLVTLELQRPNATEPLPVELPPMLADTGASQNQAAAKSGAPEQPEAESAAAGEENEAEDKTDGKERLKAFFPRRRVPAEQIKSLERRGRFW